MSFANLMSVAAVFIALGGGAYAINVGKNAIKTKNIKNNAVKTKKIANNAVKTGKIANNAVTGPKIANDAVQGSKVKDLVYTPITTFGAGCSTASTMAGYFLPGAAIDAQGVVHLRGGVTGCASAADVYTLPAQFRPSKAVEVAGFNGGVAGFADGVFIETDGDVSYTAAAGIKSLDGITYTP